MSKYPSIAAVDLGSNSFHLVLAREVDGRLEILHKEKQRVYLAAGLDDRFRLNQDATDRALAVLRQFADTLRDFPAANVRVAATYTLRRAKNLPEFLAQAKNVFPYSIQVISGQEEARLIYQGVARHQHHDGRRLVIDIGGGSTELVIGLHDRHRLLSSRNMGCVSFSRQFFADGKITEKRFARAIVRAEQELEAVLAAYLAEGWQTVIGTSGTIKTLQALCATAEQDTPLTLTALEALKQRFIAAGHTEFLASDPLLAERKDTACGGLAILIALFRQLNIDSMTYCDHSLREGLLYEMQEKLAHKDIRIHTIDSLGERYAVDKRHAANICDTLDMLFCVVAPVWRLENEDHLTLLHWAARLHEIGLSINSSGLHKHSAYILANTQLPGFTREQQAQLSCLVRCHRKKIRPDTIPLLESMSEEQLHGMIALLRLAVLLNRKRQTERSPEIRIEAASRFVMLRFPDGWLDTHTLLRADLEQEQGYLKKLSIDLDVG